MTVVRPQRVVGCGDGLFGRDLSRVSVGSRGTLNFLVSRPDFVLKTTLDDQVLFRAALRRAKESNTASHIAMFFDVVSCPTGDFCFCEGALRLMSEENAGGSSEVSEAFSMEILARRFGAFDTISEMQIKYWSPHWKKIDYICSLSSSRRVGVSVTRLMGFPHFDQVTRKDCIRLLKKKLYGLIVAKSGVDPAHHYDSSILHVFCASVQVAEMLALVICQANMLFSGEGEEVSGSSSELLATMTEEEVAELAELAFLYEEELGGSFSDHLIIHITVASNTACIFSNQTETVAFASSC
jgi:hypothetical protein